MIVVPLAVISAAAAVATWWRSRASSVEQQARDLARVVRGERQRFLDQALRVRYDAPVAAVRFGTPVEGALPLDVEALLVRWQRIDGRDAGTIEDVASYFSKQKKHRLVVIGPEGAGKTVFLSRLVVDLIDSLPLRPAAGRFLVPVMFSLTSCDLGAAGEASPAELARRLKKWVARRLVDDYGLRTGPALALVEEGWVLPVLDGLDEMDEDPERAGRSRAAFVVRALTDTDRLPVVLACRTDAYVEVAATEVSRSLPDPGSATILGDAVHVSLRPLNPNEAFDFLVDRLHGTNGDVPERWQPLLEALDDPRSATRRILASPLYLSLTVAVYGKDDTTPGDMASMSFDQARRHLIAGLLPALVEIQPPGVSRDPALVTAWLSTLARYIRDADELRRSSKNTIYLPDLWLVADRLYPYYTAPAVAVALGGVLAITMASVPLDGGAVVAWVSLFLTGVAAWSTLRPSYPLERLDLGTLTRRPGRKKAAANLTRGLALGLFVGLMTDLAWGLTMGLAVGVVRLLAFGLKGEVVAAPTPAVLMRQSLTYSAAVTLTAATAFTAATAITFGPLVGLTPWLLPGVLVGFIVGLSAGKGYVWLRYAAGVLSAARRGLLPRRLPSLLDWALEAGLLRMAGVFVQFRHRALQDWLLETNSVAGETLMPRHR